MEKLTKIRLAKILNEGLSLKDPQYFFERVGSRLVGNIVSSSFKGKHDHERQKMIWDALVAVLGQNSATLVGMLLAFTPEEWNLGADEQTAPAKRKKVG